MSPTVIAVLLASAALLLWIWLRLLPSLRRAQQYIAKISVCGYLPDPPTRRATRNMNRFMRVLTFIQVGKLNVLGRENLDKPDGPYVFSSNHPHYIDAAIVPLILDGRPARYMAHREVMRFGFGLGALMCGPAGAFVSQDGIKDGGVRARAAGVKVLKSGQTLVALPEGLTNFSPTMLPLKEGAVRMTQEAARELGRPTYIVPAYIRYGRYPGPWIQKYTRPVQYLLVFLGFLWYRRGAKVVIGKPISTAEMPADPAEATLLLRRRIEELDPGRV